MAASFALIGNIDVVASVTNFAVYAIFLMMNASVIALRIRMPDAPRTVRAPFNIGRVALLPIAAMCTIVLMLVFLEPAAWALGAGALLAGGVAWFAVGPRRSTTR